MLVTAFGMETFFKSKQEPNAPAPMLVKLSGRVTLIKPQLLSALGPRAVTPSGMVMLNRLRQP